MRGSWWVVVEGLGGRWEGKVSVEKEDRNAWVLGCLGTPSTWAGFVIVVATSKRISVVSEKRTSNSLYRALLSLFSILISLIC